ncbi:hypothetical protein Tco_0751740 [Tanacetum coccineum]|uniref:Uncharacterized protein n=1 Tax=Tanacetum coccineum TaxID=301880 RepID=A0ABQ4Z4V4_9ASTR
MLSYSNPHGSTSNSNCSACSKIPYHWEMQQILLDHPLSYALTATTDVLVVYLQQLWQTVHKVPNTRDTIRFKLDTQEITYIMDMFRAILKLLVETLDNPFVAPITIKTIKSFMNKVGYQGVVDKFSAFCTKNLAQPWQTMFKKFPKIPQRVDEDYYSIKDDTLLVSVYTIGNVLVRGILIPDAFLTEEIHATGDFKKYDTVFVRVDVLMNQPQPVVSTQETHRSTPRAHRTPIVSTASPQGKKRKQTAGESMAKAAILSLTLHKSALAAKAQENIAKVQEKLDEEEIENMVEGDEDEE